MPTYAVLRYTPEPADPNDITVEQGEELDAFRQLMVERGVQILDAQALQASTTARSVRGGMVTDGPFIEAKEVLAGFAVVEADDIDAATEIAKLIPTFGEGGIEVRPLFVP